MNSEMQERLLISGADQGGDLKGRVCEESNKIWRVSLLSVISRVTLFGCIIITQSFVGHISSNDLAGYALVQTLGIQFVNGVLISLPVGLMLVYLAGLQVKGLWLRMLGGVICEMLVLSVLMWRTNWNEEVLKASAQLKKWYLKSPDEANRKTDVA